ncbi:hypothetical protein [Aliarcobacter lanthieri]|uniref:hypothetical protein n=1 Tax=Aliarcobacter lanthieri TaxID=1355374 RepID=UPI003AADD85B
MMIKKKNQIKYLNGDEYILKALNRTNEKFEEEDINARKGRWDLEKLYENISLASDYRKYKNENLITDTIKLQEINTLFQTIQNEIQKEKALKIAVNNINYKILSKLYNNEK